jgi:hypothetical protein
MSASVDCDISQGGAPRRTIRREAEPLIDERPELDYSRCGRETTTTHAPARTRAAHPGWNFSGQEIGECLHHILKNEIIKWTKVIKSAGIKAE